MQQNHFKRMLVFGKDVFFLDKLSQTNECITDANNLVLLASSKSGLQQVINDFAAACGFAGIQINSFTSEVFYLSRNLVQCFFPIGRVLLKQVEGFYYFRVAFMSDERQDKKMTLG